MNCSGISRESIVGKLLRFPLRAIPRQAQVPILQGPLRGKKWLVGSGDHGCWLGSYEWAKQKQFARAIERGDVVWDLGANVGFFSLLASLLVGPEGRVFSFEPVPRNLAFLRRHLELNAVTNCSVLDVAVHSTDAFAGFDTKPGSVGGHLTNDDSQTSFTVRTVTLAGLVASGKISPPNVVKCDIEGSEYDALLGAESVLREYGPTIFIETHGNHVHQQCCRLLEDLNYHLSSLDTRPLTETTEIMATRSQPMWCPTIPNQSH